MRGSKQEQGFVLSINPKTNWTQVAWAEKGPKYCHLYELEKVDVHSA
jgi:hypothetical protein